jgi:hypothetical protein
MTREVCRVLLWDVKRGERGGGCAAQYEGRGIISQQIRAAVGEERTWYG